MFKKLKKITDYFSPHNWKNDTLSGLTVALALVPEAIAFAFVAGVNPMVGLYAAFMMSFIAGLLSGRPGMISGATGALAVVMVTLVSQYGIEYLFATVILMGIIQILFGVLKLGKFARIIPYPVMLGFVNGLAIVIGLAQLTQFKNSAGEWLPLPVLLPMVGFIFLTMAIMYFLPKFTTAVPSALTAIIVVTFIVIFFNIDIPTVKDMLSGASISGGLPDFHIPNIPLTFHTIQIIFPYALILACIGLIESLMTLSLIDEITNTRGKSNKECLAQGVANIVTGFFGGMGGCAMVGQSMININSNGRGRWTGIVAGIGLLLFILFGLHFIEQIPLAALVGVMFMVVIGTFSWSSLRILHKIPRSDAFVLVFVSIITVFTDLAIAVVSGIIISALVFSWKKSTNIEIQDSVNKHEKQTIHHKISGYIFFASTKNFSELFAEKIFSDPENVYIDFQNAKILDHSGIEAINSLTKKYKDAGKKLHLQHLSSDCRKLLLNAEDIIEVNIAEDPKYKVADDMLES